MNIWFIIFVGFIFGWSYNLQCQVNNLKDEVYYLKNKE